MKYGLSILFAASLALVPTRGQVTITGADMFSEPGLYYRAYANAPTANYPVSNNVIGTAGANQFWDFSSGPTDVVYRFDYLSTTNVDANISADFPDAKMAEKKTDEAKGESDYLFFTQVPGVGRRVYGAYSDPTAMARVLQALGSLGTEIAPTTLFTAPILDFPDQISFGQQWNTVATYEINLTGNSGDPTDPTSDPTDPTGGGGFFDASLQVTQTSNLKADAWGTVVLPDGLGGFGQGLRVNEDVTYDIAMDDGSGNMQHVETDYSRNYYWLMPGRGIVAALASTQGSAPVADNFPSATQFWRMFQTNKKATTTGGGSCVDPNPVNDLKIRFSGGQVLLSWSKANCASQYRVEYSTNAIDQTSWKPISGMVTNQLYLLDSASGDHQRFYRVVSIK